MASYDVDGVKFSCGNKKLPKGTYILNMGSATECPSKALGMCQCSDKCYAFKAERMWPAVLPFRKAQKVAFRKYSPKRIANALLKRSKRARLHKMTHLRFSESGDFENQKAVEKMASICKILSENGVICYGYTARKDLDMSSLVKYATVNGSGFKVNNEFRFIPRGESSDGCDKVCAGNCRICSLCSSGNNLIIGVNEH